MAILPNFDEGSNETNMKQIHKAFQALECAIGFWRQSWSC